MVNRPKLVLTPATAKVAELHGVEIQIRESDGYWASLTKGSIELGICQAWYGGSQYYTEISFITDGDYPIFDGQEASDAAKLLHIAARMAKEVERG